MNIMLKINNSIKDLGTWLDELGIGEDEPIDKLLDAVYTNSRDSESVPDD